MTSTRAEAMIQEGKRKLFHLLGVVYVLMYLWWGRALFIRVLVLAIAVGAAVEWLRLRHPPINRWILTRFGDIHRPKETTGPSGIFWTMGGVALTAWAVPQSRYVVAAILYLIVGDGLAGWVGRVWGGTMRFRGKSLQGSLACFLGCGAVGMGVFGGDIGLSAGGALLATVLEFLALPPDDNLTIPFFSGLGLMGLGTLM